MLLIPLLVFVQATADPRLEKAVTLRLKIVPVEEAVAGLSQASGIPLQTGQAVRPLKATVLVEDCTVRRTMERLADALRCQWEKTSQGYRLVLDVAAVSREASTIRLETARAKASAEATLRAIVEGATIPFDDVEARMSKAFDRLGSEPEGSAKAKTLLHELKVLQIVNEQAAWTVGGVLRKLGEPAIQKLMAGETLVASTKPRRGQVLLSPLSLTAFDPFSADVHDAPKSGGFQLRVNPETWELELKSSLNLEDGFNRGVMDQITRLEVDAPAESPLEKELDAWNVLKPAASEATRRPKADSLPRPSQWWLGHHSEADELEYIHDSTGIPVVAMAYRVPRRRESLLFKGSVAEYLAAWRREQGGYFRFTDGFLMHRPANFWRRRSLEIPESVFQRLERTPCPSLNDYAAAAMAVKLRQAEELDNENETLTRVSPDPLSTDFEALRFWANLSPITRGTLRRGGKVEARALSASERELIASVLGNRRVLSGESSGTAHAGTWLIAGNLKDATYTYGQGRRSLDPASTEPFEMDHSASRPGLQLLLRVEGNRVRDLVLPLTGAEPNRSKS